MTGKDAERIDAQLVEIRASLNRIDDAVRGNGKPGLTIRMDRIERSRAVHSKALWTILLAVCGLGASWVRSFWS